MLKRSPEEQRDLKLEAVAFLREHETGNRMRLNHVNHILTGTQEDSQGLQNISCPDVQPEREERAFWRSFRTRCAIALFLTILMCVGKMSGNLQVTQSVHNIKQVVLEDESENLFDFIEQITYTHEYEKINAEG